MEKSELKDGLSAILGVDRVMEQQGSTITAHLPDWWESKPEFTVFPKNSEEIVALVKLAQETRVAIVPCGGGTQIHTGYQPSADRSYVLLSLSKMNRILDYQPEDMTITCEPGTTLSELQERLRTRRQFLALDTPLPDKATLGGIVSTNATGFWRPMFGAPRDLLIGVRAVTPDGEMIRGGGKVVKNVAGYDTCKLFTGAWGTLGILTELTFRVRPMPDCTKLFAWKTPDISTAAKVGLQLHHAQLAPVCFIATNEFGSGASLIIELQGTEERVEWQSKEFARLATSFGVEGAAEPFAAPERDRLLSRQARQESNVAARISCLPSDVASILEKLKLSEGFQVTAICETGTLSLALPELTEAHLKCVQNSVPKGANLFWTKLDASTQIASGIEVWGEKRGDFLLHKALKEKLDPTKIFSPGRFFGRI